MSILSRYKAVIIGGVVLVAAFFAYSYFFAAPQAPVLSSTSPDSSAAVDQDLIALLLTLRNIKLDDSIFTDTAFRSLQDFSQALVPEPVGRANPFAPLGGISPAPKVTTPAPGGKK